MGLKEKAIGQAAKIAAEKIVVPKLQTLEEKISQIKLETKKDLKSIHPNNNHLWVFRHSADSHILSSYPKTIFTIVDDFDNIIYTAKENSKEYSKTKIILYNKRKRQVGKIVEKPFSFHKPKSVKNQYDFTIQIGKDKVGELNRVLSIKNDIITLNKGEVTATRQKKRIYSLIDINNNLIAEIHSKTFFSFLDYNNKDNEILIILFALLL